MCKTLIPILMVIMLTMAAKEARSETGENGIPRNASHPYLARGTKDFSRIGPYEIFTADSSSSIRFQFAGQLWLTFEDKDSGNDRKREILMKARRLRLILNGTIYEPDLSYKLHLSTAPKSLELMDFYFNYKFNNKLQCRFGQYKTPFTRYRIQSFQRLVFVDWAITTKYFGAERQMGVAFHNGYETPSPWSYVLGIFSGVNARASHAVGLPLVYGEIIANPSNLSDPGSNHKFHPELFLHITRNSNKIEVRSNSDEQMTGSRYSAGINVAWDLDPTAYHDFQIRLAPELLVKYRGAAMFAAGYVGYSEPDYSEKTQLAMVGSVFQTSYRFNNTYEISIRYSFVDFKDRLLSAARQRADRIIVDSDNDPNITDQYQNAGRINREEEITLGFNTYIMGHYLKWQNDISRLRHLLEDEVKNDYLARSQFQLTF